MLHELLIRRGYVKHNTYILNDVWNRIKNTAKQGMTQGSKAWALRKQDEQRIIQSAETQF